MQNSSNMARESWMVISFWLNRDLESLLPMESTDGNECQIECCYHFDAFIERKNRIEWFYHHEKSFKACIKVILILYSDKCFHQLLDLMQVCHFYCNRYFCIIICLYLFVNMIWLNWSLFLNVLSPCWFLKIFLFDQIEGHL